MAESDGQVREGGAQEGGQGGGEKDEERGKGKKGIHMYLMCNLCYGANSSYYGQGTGMIAEP